jgi:hypothetical protein
LALHSTALQDRHQSRWQRERLGESQRWQRGR